MLARLFVALCTLVAGVPLLAQPPAALPRVAILHTGTPETDRKPRLSFLEGMREQGYVEGRNMLLDETYVAGREERFREIILEILGRKPAVLVLGGSQAVRAAKAATSTVPIVVFSMADPVGQGIAASLSHPGGNITGVAILSEVLIAKRLEILLEVVPNAKRIAYIANPKNPVMQSLAAAASAAAKRLGANLTVVAAATESELDQALKGVTRRQYDAVLMSQDVSAFVSRKMIAGALARNRVPAMHGFVESVEAGGLMSYSGGWETRRHAATFVRRILQGAKPGDLPFEQPTHMELVLNANAARDLGITFPQTVLLRAARVIE